MTNPDELPKQYDLTITEHLEELRYRIIRALFSILVGMGLAWSFSSEILDLIRKPIEPYLAGGGLVFTGVTDKFVTHIKISLIAGVILASPFWLYQVWKFIAPGLYSKEKKFAFSFVMSGSLLFSGGVFFVYYLVFPAAFKYLLQFGGSIDKPMITITEYISFFTVTTLLFGAAFELPLILVILGIMGVIDHHLLRAKRRIAIVALSILCAIVTPPDALSMMMLMVPMVILYELSILIIQFLARPSA